MFLPRNVDQNDDTCRSLVMQVTFFKRDSGSFILVKKKRLQSAVCPVISKFA